MKQTDFTIRRAELADAAGIAHVHIQSWKTTYVGRLEQDFLDNLEKTQGEGRLKLWKSILTRASEGERTLVAEEKGKVVAFVNFGPHRDLVPKSEGEIYAIYALKAAQGKGIGKKLFQRACADLKHFGFQTMSLWVMKGNPTEGFYSHMGGSAEEEKLDRVGTKNITEVRYRFSLV
jgi:GNAT superfamily N-acetyltransferase